MQIRHKMQSAYVLKFILNDLWTLIRRWYKNASRLNRF